MWGEIQMFRKLWGTCWRFVVALAVTMGLASVAVPASADTHTIYMTSQDSCRYDCAIVVMQVRGDKVRFKMSMDQANGVGSIGWMRRKGDTLSGLTSGSECSKPTKQRMQVAGKGPRTHFVDMQVTTRDAARAFGKRHCGLSCGVPNWPWKSMKDWRADYEKFCE